VINRRFQVLPVGDAAVMVVLGSSLRPADVRRSRAIAATLAEAFGPAALDVVPAFASVLVRFDRSLAELAQVMACARGAAEAAAEQPPPVTRALRVGVCFGGQHGPDLDEVARAARLAPDRVCELFCAADYEVAFLGFVAGFPYLLGLPEQLAVARLQTPRLRVPAGSVAVAGVQCGIYPRACPGGWRVLGRTAATLFDPAADPPAAFRPGDSVRFFAVERLEDATLSICA
jgi:KipI family sensor histidine kinase inhibitor